VTLLTPVQQRLLDGINAFKERTGFPPTVRELAAEIGLSSPATVHHHLAALERKGVITREPNKPRTIVVDRTENNDAEPLDDLPQPGAGELLDPT
jgi:repressor LexA